MNRIILVYGSIAGVILVASLAIAMGAGAHGGMVGMVIGYLSMLIALSMVFVGVKRYRDEQMGGVIRFGRAFGVGVGIATVASVFYVLGWEIYMWSTDYTFAASYARSAIEHQQAAGATSAEIAALKTQMDDFAMSYANPLFRMLMTLSEIAPVALMVPLISAALLRKPSFMPARG
jgi:hypothetical protein